jgi:23S rRNA (uridine2552-2'-O)-methyltransferase
MSGKRVRGGRTWMEEHLKDPYVKRAQTDGYRARAAYKLIEIDERDRLLKPGVRVVDLGAAPGSWSQVAVRRAGPTATIVGVDLLEVAPMPGLHFIQGDFNNVEVLNAVLAALGDRPADLVLSDMAPNISGIASADQARAIGLADLALDFATRALRPGGHFVVKLFQGSGYAEYISAMRPLFESVVTRKPDASRDRSSEMFAIGKGYKSESPR